MDVDVNMDARGWKCDRCGAAIAYDPSSGMLRCGHCGNSQHVPAGAGAVVEHDLFEGLRAAPRGFGAGGARASRCAECGAQVVFSDGVVATRCTFCGSPRVLAEEAHAQALRPESLVPFSLDKKRANQMFGRWLKRLWLRPSDLHRIARVEAVSGVYVPFWTFDALAHSRWSAEAGYYYDEDEEYTVQIEDPQGRRSERRTRRTRKVRWQPASGERRDRYDDVLICGSRGLPGDLASELRTFDTKRLQPYAPGFLAGFRAEEYGVELQDGFGLARQFMEGQQRGRCGRDVPGDTQRELRVTTALSSVTYKLVLLPVWIAAYRYRSKVYRFLVNGQTGEVVGKAPWSVWKVTLLVVVIAALLGVLIYFLSQAGPPPE